MTLKPDGLAGAQWRLLGEDDTRWRNNGVTATGLTPGFYLAECKPVAGRATPPPLPVTVENGPATPLTATYFLAATVAGATPGVVPFETVTAEGPLGGLSGGHGNLSCQPRTRACDGTGEPELHPPAE